MFKQFAVKQGLIVLSIVSCLLLASVWVSPIQAQWLDDPASQPIGQSLVVNDRAVSQLLPPIKEAPQLINDYAANDKQANTTLAMATSTNIPNSTRANNVISQYTPTLKRQLESRGLQLGSPILIRIFKVPSILEVWIKKDNKYVLFKTYSICRFSGKLGPKLKNGDHQAPEGFYTVPASALNPNSSYFLSFNLGYPNQYDRYYNRTGSLLMVHGECASVGCYAMTNARMSEIYTLMYKAFANGQTGIQVHAYPFALTENNMRKMKKHPWYGFWLNLKQGYDTFNTSHQPLRVSVNEGRYQFKTIN